MIIAFKGHIKDIREGSFILNVNNVFYEIKATKNVLDTLHQGDEPLVYVCKQSSNIYGFLTEQEMNNFKEILIANPSMPPNVILRLLNVNPTLNKEDINKANQLNDSKENIEQFKKEICSGLKSLGYGLKESIDSLERVAQEKFKGSYNKMLNYKIEDIIPEVLKYLSKKETVK